MSPWLLPLVAFCAMVPQDILGVLLVRAEVAGRAHRAGLLDMAQDACRIAGLMANADTLLIRRDLPLSVAVVAVTLAADYIGTRAGVRLGQRLDGRAVA